MHSELLHEELTWPHIDHVWEHHRNKWRPHAHMYVVSLRHWPLTFSPQNLWVHLCPNCTEVVKLVKFPEAVCKTLSCQLTCRYTDSRTNGSQCLLSPVANSCWEHNNNNAKCSYLSRVQWTRTWRATSAIESCCEAEAAVVDTSTELVAAEDSTIELRDNEPFPDCVELAHIANKCCKLITTGKLWSNHTIKNLTIRLKF